MDRKMTVFEGNLTTGNAKYGIVVARFNEFINAKLLAGALDALSKDMVFKKNKLILLGCQEHLKFRLLRKKWRVQINMMPLSA